MPVGRSGLGASMLFSLHCLGGNKETQGCDRHVFPPPEVSMQCLLSESSYTCWLYGIQSFLAVGEGMRQRHFNRTGGNNLPTFSDSWGFYWEHHGFIGNLWSMVTFTLLNFPIYLHNKSLHLTRSLLATSPRS